MSECNPWLIYLFIYLIETNFLNDFKVVFSAFMGFFLFFYIYLIKVEPILQHGIWFMWGNNFGAASTFQETNPPLSRCVPQRFSCLCCLRISEMPAIIFLREHSTCWWCDLKKQKKTKTNLVPKMAKNRIYFKHLVILLLYQPPD